MTIKKIRHLLSLSSRFKSTSSKNSIHMVRAKTPYQSKLANIKLKDGVGAEIDCPIYGSIESHWYAGAISIC